MASVGQAFAILRGRLTGNKEEAQAFLDDLPRPQLLIRNRMESKMRAKARKMPLKLGQRPRRMKGKGF